MLLRNDNSNYIASTVGKIADAGLKTVAHHTVYHFFFFFMQAAKCELPLYWKMQHPVSWSTEKQHR